MHNEGLLENSSVQQHVHHQDPYWLGEMRSQQDGNSVWQTPTSPHQHPYGDDTDARIADFTTPNCIFMVKKSPSLDILKASTIQNAAHSCSQHLKTGREHKEPHAYMDQLISPHMVAIAFKSAANRIEFPFGVSPTIPNITKICLPERATPSTNTISHSGATNIIWMPMPRIPHDTKL